MAIFKFIHLLGILLSLLVPSLPISQASHAGDEHVLLLSQDHSLSSEDPLSRLISTSPLLSLHRSLCEIESITNHEHAVGHYLFSYLKKHGFNVIRQEVPQPPGFKGKEKRFNVFAWPRGNASTAATGPESKDEDKDDDDDVLGDFSPKVILTSHIDTVPPFIPYSLSLPPTSSPSSSSSSCPPLQGEAAVNRSDILISGRGTVDAKACVAAQIHAILSLLSSPPPPHPNQHPGPLPVALLFVVSEESTGAGMKHFSLSPLHRHLSQVPNPYHSLIFGEPTQSRLASGHKGILLFSLIARGRAAHSGYPWLGRSATSMLIPVLAAVDRLGDVPAGLARSDKYGPSTVNIGLVRAGVAVNVVPDFAEAGVAVRLAGGTVEQAKVVIVEAVRKVDAAAAAAAHVSVVFAGQGYAPVDLDADVPGFGPEPVTVNYGTDVPNLVVGRSGVKRYLYGPGSILVAHGSGEGLRGGDLEGAVEGYRRLIEAGLER